MARKPTIEFIRTEIEKEGYKLITKIYRNNKQRLELLCPREHTYFVSWSGWNLSNSRCPHCYDEDRKPSIEFIRSEVEKEGYKLVTKVYKNSKQKLELICSREHSYLVSWNHWHSLTSRCNRCYDEDNKPSIEFIRVQFAKEGYILLTKVYKNNTQKLDYVCPNGYKHQITWGHWNTSKARCPCSKCNLIRHNLKYTLEQARQEFKKAGYTLLVDEYINSKTKMKCKCNREHIVYMSLYAIMHGHKCRVCIIEDQTGAGNPNWKGGISKEPYCQEWTKELRESIKERDGYKCMNPYCASKKPDRLSIHHIDYNKKNCRHQNLISTCKSCNSGANGNREWHEAWYKAIMYRRYGYIYD